MNRIDAGNTSDQYSLTTTQKFNVTGILLTYNVAAAVPNTYVYLGDWDGASTTNVDYKLLNVIKVADTVFIDLSSAPITLLNVYGTGYAIGTFPALAAASYLNYTLFGFIEEN